VEKYEIEVTKMGQNKPTFSYSAPVAMKAGLSKYPTYNVQFGEGVVCQTRVKSD